jgi:hypothetical protein
MIHQVGGNTGLVMVLHLLFSLGLALDPLWRRYAFFMAGRPWPGDGGAKVWLKAAGLTSRISLP